MPSTLARRLPSSASRAPYSLRERELGSTTIDCRARKAIKERDPAYKKSQKNTQNEDRANGHKETGHHEVAG